MADRWFRFYSEALDDPKVQMLPDPLFKIWVNLLCIACKHNGALPSIEDISFALRATINETEEAVSTLLKANLLDERKNQHGQTLTPHNWAKRQFKSDSSTERVKRFRNVARNKNVTPSESDTEQIQKRNKKEIFLLNGLQESFNRFWQVYPSRNGKKLNKAAAMKLFGKLSAEDQMLCIVATGHYAQSDLVTKGLGIKDPQRFIRDGKEQEPWKDWIEPETKSVNGNGDLSKKICWKRIEDGDNLRPCKGRVVGIVNGNAHCDQHPVVAMNGVTA